MIQYYTLSIVQKWYGSGIQRENYLQIILLCNKLANMATSFATHNDFLKYKYEAKPYVSSNAPNFATTL